jgi:4-amino-4-deoxy-L-arabinose transferase-like glycosyltransferase
MYKIFETLKKHNQKILLSALLLVSSFFMFYGYNLPLTDYDEATYAQVIQHSQASGNYFSFVRNGSGWFEKPPLYFWQAFVTTKIFGFTEFALRLPSIICGILGVLLTYLLAKKLSGNHWTGLLAGAILTLTGVWAYATTQIRMDVPVSVSILAAVYFFILGWEKPKMLFYASLAIAIGVLYKSVIGLLALPIFLILSLIYKKWDWLKQNWFWFGMVVMILLILPWHIYESLLFGSDFWNPYLMFHVLHRFGSALSNITTFGYVQYLLIVVEPFIVIFPVAVVWLFWRFRKNPLEPRAALSALAIVSFLFLFFAISRTKLFAYLMPIYPFLAIFLAETGMLLFNRLKTVNQKNWFIVGLCIIGIFGLINTVWQKIYLRKSITLEYQIAEEERQVGLYLRNHPYPAHAFLFKWSWPETLRYYSQREIGSISEGDPMQPYGQFVIVPSGLWTKDSLPPDEFISRARLIFHGIAIELYEMSERK